MTAGRSHWSTHSSLVAQLLICFPCTVDCQTFKLRLSFIRPCALENGDDDDDVDDHNDDDDDDDDDVIFIIIPPALWGKQLYSLPCKAGHQTLMNA